MYTDQLVTPRTRTGRSFNFSWGRSRRRRLVKGNSFQLILVHGVYRARLANVFASKVEARTIRITIGEQIRGASTLRDTGIGSKLGRRWYIYNACDVIS